MDKKLLIYRIDSLLEHIDLVFNDTNGLSSADIEKSNLLLRATCFSVAQIGEMMNQLEKELSPKYDRLPWADARKMRNIIVHDYVGTDVEQVYSTIQYDENRAASPSITIIFFFLSIPFTSMIHCPCHSALPSHP